MFWTVSSSNYLVEPADAGSFYFVLNYFNNETTVAIRVSTATAKDSLS